MRKPYFALLIVVLCLAITGGAQAQAQSANLLENPAFNPPWSKRWDDCKGAVLEEVQVPVGWEPYFVCQGAGDPPNINRTPEYRMVSSADYAYRVRSSPSALRYFNFWALNRSAGVYQNVSGIKRGSRLRFSLWVQLWTSNIDIDPPSSVYEPGNLEARVCIAQEAGKPNFASPTIVCSAWERPWDVYKQLTVEATASGSQVTVILNTRAEFAVKHNDVMADDAELVVIGNESIPVSTPTSIAQTLPLTDTTITAPIGYAPQVVVVSNRLIYLRSKPTFQSAPVALVSKRMSLLVRGITPDRQWWQVLYRNQLVWVSALFTLPNPAAWTVGVVR